MNKLNVKEIRDNARQRLGNKDYRRLVMIHTGVTVAFALVSILLQFVLAEGIGNTGGLSGMGTRSLLETFQTVLETLANADVDEIEAIVRPCGLGKSKARDIKACMQMLMNDFGGRVPDSMKELLKLPGVGRKSANLVMGDVYGQPAIVTDTHCIRLSNRIGLVKDLKDPKKVEMELWKIIPPEESNNFCHRLVDHGRAVCTARTTPFCDKCVLSDICKKVI